MALRHNWRSFASMQFYSDSSSDESSDDEDFLNWNPNEMIEELSQIQNEDEKKASQMKILETFVDQRRPLITPTMKNFLLQEDIFKRLIQYVTRLNEEPSITLDPSQVRPLNFSDKTEKNVQRSFTVTEFFADSSDHVDELLDFHLELILHELFQIFEPNSFGNFHHFEKILDQLLTRYPVRTTKILVQEDLLWKMFDFLHERAIVDILLGFFCCEFQKQSDSIQFYRSLVDRKVFEKLGARVYNKGQKNPSCAAEFFVKLLEKLVSFEMSGILFIGLCRTPTFIDSMFNAISEPGFPFEQRKAAAFLLRELLFKSGEKMFDQSDCSPLPNMLSAVQDKLHQYSKRHVNALCNVLLESENAKGDQAVNYSAYTVRRPFGMYRFTLMEVLSDTVVSAPDSLDSIPGPMWKLFLSWFIEYKHNNLLHCQIYAIIECAIRNHHLPSLKLLLSKYKLLTKIIDHYRSNPQTTSKGFVIKLCNILRFTADLEPQEGYVKHHLASHEVFKAFLPTLREETIKQIKQYSDLQIPDQDLDIDLGSMYAMSLGYEQVPNKEEPKSKKKKKKKKKKSKKKATKSTEEDKEEKESGAKRMKGNHVAAPSTTKESKPQMEAKGKMKPEVTNPDDDSDPRDSAAAWWQDMKSKLNAEQSAKKDVSSEELMKNLKE